MRPPQFPSQNSKYWLPSTHPNTSNLCQHEDVSLDIGNENQDDDASFVIGHGNEIMDGSCGIGNGKQDDDARIVICDGNQRRDAKFNVHDRIQNGRNAINEVDAEVLELAQVFQSLGTEGILN